MSKTYIDTSKNVSETIQYVLDNGKSTEHKVELLNRLKNKSLRWYVHALYFRDLTKYPVPVFEKNKRDVGICRANIHNSINRIEAAFRVYDIKPDKYDDLITLVLEEMHKNEAQLIINLLKGKKITGITKAIWKQVYPEFFRL